MQLSWHWPWAFLAGVIVVLAVAGVTLLVAARHKTDGIESARTFSLMMTSTRNPHRDYSASGGFFHVWR